MGPGGARARQLQDIVPAALRGGVKGFFGPARPEPGARQAASPSKRLLSTLGLSWVGSRCETGAGLTRHGAACQGRGNFAQRDWFRAGWQHPPAVTR